MWPSLCGLLIKIGIVSLLVNGQLAPPETISMDNPSVSYAPNWPMTQSDLNCNEGALVATTNTTSYTLSLSIDQPFDELLIFGARRPDGASAIVSLDGQTMQMDTSQDADGATGCDLLLTIRSPPPGNNQVRQIRTLTIVHDGPGDSGTSPAVLTVNQFVLNRIGEQASSGSGPLVNGEDGSPSDSATSSTSDVSTVTSSAGNGVSDGVSTTQPSQTQGPPTTTSLTTSTSSTSSSSTSSVQVTTDSSTQVSSTSTSSSIIPQPTASSSSSTSQPSFTSSRTSTPPTSSSSSTRTTLTTDSGQSGASTGSTSQAINPAVTNPASTQSSNGSQESSSSAPENKPSWISKHSGAVAGAVVGGVIAVLAIIALAIGTMRRRRRQETSRFAQYQIRHYTQPLNWYGVGDRDNPFAADPPSRFSEYN